MVLGGGLMVFGAFGLLDAAPATRPAQVGLGLVTLDVVHDALIAPAACLIGWILVRALPSRVGRPVRAGLFASAVLLLVAWPALRGYGRDHVPDNATVAPLHYGTAVATVLAVVWVAVAVWILAAATRADPEEP
jgi:hypothetical protein